MDPKLLIKRRYTTQSDPCQTSPLSNLWESGAPILQLCPPESVVTKCKTQVHTSKKLILLTCKWGSPHKPASRVTRSKQAPQIQTHQARVTRKDKLWIIIQIHEHVLHYVQFIKSWMKMSPSENATFRSVCFSPNQQRQGPHASAKSCFWRSLSDHAYLSATRGDDKRISGLSASDLSSSSSTKTRIAVLNFSTRQ
jgi:hypothetical protein